MGLSPEQKDSAQDVWKNMEVYKMSAEQLRALRKEIELAEKALTTDFESLSPSERYKLALKAGVRDKSYSTVRYGTISDYSGEAEVTVGGRKYKVVGHGPRGTAEYVSKEGFIEFIPLEGSESEEK